MSTSQRIRQFQGFKRDAPFAIHTKKHKHCSPLAYLPKTSWAKFSSAQVLHASCMQIFKSCLLPITIMISERGFQRNRKSKGILVVVLSNRDTKHSYRKKKIVNYMWWQILAKLIVIITSLYINIYIKSLCATSKTNTMLYSNYILKKKRLTLQKYLLVSTRNSKNSSIFSENLHSVDLILITSSHLNVKSRLRNRALT